jgi:hypothetical protein
MSDVKKETFTEPEVQSQLESNREDTSALVIDLGILSRLRFYEQVMDRKLGLETNGPERILEENRHPPKDIVMIVMWASATMNISCFTTGFLGWELGLSLKQSILVTIFATLLGSAVSVFWAKLA